MIKKRSGQDEIKSVNLKALLLLLLVSWEGGLSCLGKHTKEGKQKQTQKKKLDHCKTDYILTCDTARESYIKGHQWLKKHSKNNCLIIMVLSQLFSLLNNYCH